MSEEVMSSRVSFGLNSEKSSAFFRHCTYVAMVLLRFSWYVGLFGSYEPSKSCRARSAFRNKPRILWSSFDMLMVSLDIKCQGGRR
jgi:hypothetical protein